MTGARLKFLLRGLVSLGLIALVARKVNWTELAAVFARLDLRWATTGWAVSFLIIAGLTLRWRILLAQQRLHLHGRTVFALVWGGQFFNSILPGSTGGDVMKIYQLCRIAPDRKAAAVATIFFDRLAALVALLTLALLGFILEPIPLQVLAGRGPVWTAPKVASLVIGLAIAGAVVGWLVFRVLRRTTWLGRLQRMLAATKTHLASGPALGVVFVLALAVHFVTFTVFYLFARSLGISITYTQVVLMVPVVLFMMLLPITINGHGLRELLLIGYFRHMEIGLSSAGGSVAPEIAVALSLLLVSNDLLWSIPGGIWYFSTFRGPVRDAGGGSPGMNA
ncbi:MAG: lysylphosphatidylglycerol synthase transmembrane domain-containing protein [Chthoniobacterales bacterium]